MGEISQAGPGIFSSLKGLYRTLIAIGQNRLELLLLELREERFRFFEALILAGLVLVLALVTLMVITMTFVIVCILEHNMWGIIFLVALLLLATVICYWQLRTRLKNWVPFSASLSEIKKDKACLEEKN